MLARIWRKRNPLALLVGMQTGAPFWKTAYGGSSKIMIYDL